MPSIRWRLPYNAYSDKEMTTFVGETHVDNLDKFYALMRDMILNPGWRAEDFDAPARRCDQCSASQSAR